MARSLELSELLSIEDGRDIESLAVDISECANLFVVFNQSYLNIAPVLQRFIEHRARQICAWVSERAPNTIIELAVPVGEAA